MLNTVVHFNIPVYTITSLHYNPVFATEAFTDDVRACPYR